MSSSEAEAGAEADEVSWRRELLARCGEAIASLPDKPPEGGSEDASPEPPSLLSFFEELAVLRNEVRKGNRRSAETFSKFGEVLETMREDSGKLRERLARATPQDHAEGPSRSLVLKLVEFLDRTARLETAAHSQAARGLLARLRAGEGWVQQAEGLSILQEHLQDLLGEAGVERIVAAPGTPFDPHLMKAVGREAPDPSGAGSLVVKEELLSGYRSGDRCLRPAEVRVSSQSPSL